jgi:hypothetical protein
MKWIVDGFAAFQELIVGMAIERLYVYDLLDRKSYN